MLKSTIAFAASLACSGAFAAASGSVVFDPTNYLKNVITAAQTTRATIESIQTQINTAVQYKLMFDNAKAMARGDLDAIAKTTGQTQLLKDLRELNAMKQALTNLNGDLGNLKSRADYFASMAQKFGMTIEQYEAKRKQLAAKGVASIEQDRKRDIEVLKQVQQSSEQLIEIQKQAGTSTTTDTMLLQTLNQQLALLNKNHVIMLESLSRSNMARQERDTLEQGKATAEAEKKLAANEDIRVNAQAARNRYEAERAAALAAIPVRQ